MGNIAPALFVPINVPKTTVANIVTGNIVPKLAMEMDAGSIVGKHFALINVMELIAGATAPDQSVLSNAAEKDVETIALERTAP